MSRLSGSSCESTADANKLAYSSCHTHDHRLAANDSPNQLYDITDEVQLDSQEYVARSVVPLAEEAYHEELERVSRQLTRQSREKDASLDTVSEELDEPQDHPVDGLFAIWQAVLALLLVFLTWGANASFGVFLNYYMSHSLFPGATNYDFALIGGIVVFLVQAPAPLICFLVAMFGQTPVLVLGLVLQTLGYILASFSTKLWQIYLCQGVLVGASFGLIFFPASLVLPTWFQKRKSTGMGICVSGSGVGGVVFSLALNKLISQTGDQRWPLRMVGLVTFATSLFSICFLRPRNKKTIDINTSRITWERTRAILKIVFNFELFKSIHYLIVGVWFTVSFLGYVICLYSYSPYASSIGLTHDQANNLLAIYNTGQAIGRPLVGHIADHYGRTNTAGFFSIYLAIMVLAFWRHAVSYGALIVLAILLGGPSAVGYVMSQSLVADILDIQERPHLMPAAWSGLNIMVSFVSPPSEVIAIALKEEKASNPFDHAQVFTGCMFLLSFLLLLFNREFLVRERLNDRKLQAQAAYLREGDAPDEDTKELLMTKIDRYDRFLENSNLNYFIRMFYPMIV